MNWANWARRRRYTMLAVPAVLVAALVQTAGPATAEPVPASVATDRQEQVLAERDGIVVSHVSVALPLPAEAPAHPAGCDRTGFLRYRAADAPKASRDADSIVVQQQGFQGGAVNSDGVAANTVRSAKKLDRNVEYWALSRRSACLDETVGFDHALKTGNYLDAVDYYFNGKPIDGHTFPGFRPAGDLPLLDHMGMDRVVRDQYELMLHEVPDQAARQQKFVCTGISLGGLVTGFFSDWDFDGDPATTADAGYNQCTAFAAQDTMVTSDPAAIQNTPLLAQLTNAIVGPTNDVVKAGFDASIMPRVFDSMPVIGTRAFMLYRLAGLAAHLEPDAESQLLDHLPHDFDIDATLNMLFAPSWSAFASNGADGTGTIRDYRFTNTALLGTLIDNNSGNFELLQQGLGVLSGGPLVEKTFPNPGSAAQVPFIGNFMRLTAGPQQRFAPADRNVLYTWRNYDDVRGVPFTTPNHEVADIREVARQLGSGGPTAYWETYFPLRLAIDIGAGYGGARGGDMTNLRYKNMSRTKPNFVAYAGDSVVQYGVGEWIPSPALAHVVSLPGYNHIDTIGAAAMQNNGKPDPSGQHLAEFIRSLT